MVKESEKIFDDQSNVIAISISETTADGPPKGTLWVTSYAQGPKSIGQVQPDATHHAAMLTALFKC